MCHCSSIHKLLKRSELSDCWQMHRYYIYVKYFMNKHTTLSLYQISVIDINIDKMQGKMCMYLLNYKIVIGALFNMANVFINSIFWLLKLKLMMPSLYSHQKNLTQCHPLLNQHLWALFPLKPPSSRSELSGCKQMHKYYIYIK